MDVTINFNCNQFELAQMMMTIGAVGLFDNMERMPRGKKFTSCNTKVNVNESDLRMLQSMLTSLRINYIIERYFGAQQDA